MLLPALHFNLKYLIDDTPNRIGLHTVAAAETP